MIELALTIPDGASPPGERPLVPEERLGRFVVRGALGAGGMGLVLEAFDPGLDRKVAVKVLRSDVWSGNEVESQIRLVREAQAMARLAHPNVVTVHEVGFSGAQAFVVMEYVEGRTLRAVLDEKPSWRVALRLLCSAGDGLAAAHRAGLVHRDFKPENVLVGADGRARVTDFGLVAAALDDDGRAHGEPTSTVWGTPGYMAPEQLRGQRGDARADQFAFAVSLHEVLYGTKPSPGGPSVPRDDVPAHVRRALERALAPDPSSRWPSMEELLARLRHDPGVARRRAIAAIAGIAFAAGGGALVLSARQAARIDCGRAGAEIATAWNDQIRRHLSEGFGTARPYGADTVQRLAGSLDAWSARWRAARVDACRATHERGEQSAALLDRRGVCLERQRVELAALVGGLSVATGPLVDRATDAVRSLPDPESCSVASAGERAADPSAAAVERELLAARTAARLGNEADAARSGEAALRRARELGAPRWLAEALAEHAQRIASIDVAGARGALEEALMHAAASGDRAVEADVALDLLELVAQEGQVARIESVLPAARAAVGATARVDLRRRLAALDARSLSAMGRTDDALAACGRLSALGADAALETAMCRCKTLYDARRHQSAVDYCQAAVILSERTYGPEHPGMTFALGVLGNVHQELGDYAKALPLKERVVRIAETAYGRRSGKCALYLHQMAATLSYMGRDTEARDRWQEVVSILGEVEDRPSLLLSQAHNMLGETLVRLGDVETGMRHARTWRAVVEQLQGADHRDLAVALISHGNTFYEAHHYDEALTVYRRGEALARRHFGDRDQLVAGYLASQAQTLLDIGNAAAAVPLVEQALEVLRDTDVVPINVAFLHLVHGRALFASGRRAAGRAALLEGRRIYASLGDDAITERKEVDELLRRYARAAHRP